MYNSIEVKVGEEGRVYREIDHFFENVATLIYCQESKRCPSDSRALDDDDFERTIFQKNSDYVQTLSYQGKTVALVVKKQVNDTSRFEFIDRLEDLVLSL